MKSNQNKIRQMLDEQERNLKQARQTVQMQKEINYEVFKTEQLQKKAKKQQM